MSHNLKNLRSIAMNAPFEPGYMCVRNPGYKLEPAPLKNQKAVFQQPLIFQIRLGSERH